jgi:hypothetical protein
METISNISFKMYYYITFLKPVSGFSDASTSEIYIGATIV